MVLVTGGTGLVGAHLLLDLTESKPLNGQKIRALYRDLNSIQKTKSLFDKYHKTNLFDSIEWVKGDIVDVPSLEVAFTGIEQVYHCAATISFDPKDENLLRKTNIEGTANVVNFCLEHKIKKLCYVSSISALGDLNENESIITEKTEWNPEKPHSDYAISKYGAEMEIWRGLQEGLGVIIVNPGVILGSGFLDQGSGLLLKKIKNGLPFYTKGITGFIAVTDVVKIMITLMQSDIKNKRFTLIATNMVFQDFLNIASDALHVKRPTIHASPVFMNLAWQADWLFSLVFRQKRKITKATAKASYSTSTYSNDKIKKELNYSFTDIKEYLNSIVSLIN